MSRNHWNSDFSPRCEFIDSRDIRKTFALPRFEEMRDFKEHGDEWPPNFHRYKTYNSGFPGGYFSSEPMTKASFNSEDFESDNSSQASGGSSGSSSGRNVRGPRVHLIPIFVEGEDSSGYASDSQSDESKPRSDNRQRETTTVPTGRHQHQQNDSNQSRYPQQRTSHTQRSKSDQDVQSKGPDPTQRKSSLQPSLSSPPSVQIKVTTNVSPANTAKPVRVTSTTSHPADDQATVAPPVTREKKQPKPKPDPMEQIAFILQEKDCLLENVKKFAGTTKDKNYRYLDEMLTRLMLKLDDVNADGHSDVRAKRKEAVREIQNCISKLEQKVAENEASQTALHQKSNCNGSKTDTQTGLTDEEHQSARGDAV